MTIQFDKYLVWQCPKCGKWNGRQNNKFKYTMTETQKREAIEKITLRCTRCTKSTNLRDKTDGGIRTKHRWVNHPMEATVIIQKMEELKATGKIEN